MPNTKQVPPANTPDDLKRLLPNPCSDGYVFFENGAGHPIQKTADFSKTNCWWMIEMSYLVYATTEDCVSTQIAKTGMQSKVFGFDRAEPPHILVAHNSQVIVIAFRGTLISNLPDVLADLAFWPEITSNGLVHKGFQTALHAGGVWDEVMRYVADIPGDQLIFFTGHSLGAALTTLARLNYRDPRGRQNVLYTFGSPRVGDQFFRMSYPSHDYRIVNEEDIVTHIPTPPLYGHVGSALGTDGAQLAGGILQNLEHQFAEIGRVLAVENMASRRARLQTYLQSQPPKPIGDHAPRIYATKIWNAL